MSEILVSIIIPIYNAERHLEECLDSCLGQTLEPIEIICINDGSTDNTEKILERYGREHSNIVILNQENQGSGIARNLGITHASGEFVAFMDSDDYYPDKEVLNKLYKAAIENGVLICGGSMTYLNNGKIDMSNLTYVFPDNKIMCYREFQSAWGFTRFLYNTHFLKSNKIIFPVYRRFQDPPFLVNAMVRAEKFYVINDYVYVIRKTDKIVLLNNLNIILGVLDGIQDILKISRENQLEKLHTDLVLALMEQHILFYKLIYNKNKNIYKYYEKMLSEIDETLLEQDCRKIRKPKLLSNDEIKHMFDQSLKKERELLTMINSYKTVLIYGAGKAGRFLYNYIRERGCIVDIDFMVSAENSGYTACGKTVKLINECVEKKDDALVIIANKYDARKMEENARRYQFQNIIVVTYDELQLFGADMMGEKSLIIF